MLIGALVDIVERPDWQWKVAGQEKVLWLLLVILVNILAMPSLIYRFVIRAKVIAVARAGSSGCYGPGRLTSAGGEPLPPRAIRWTEHVSDDGPCSVEASGPGHGRRRYAHGRRGEPWAQHATAT